MMTDPEYEKRIILQKDACENGMLRTSELFRLFQRASEEHVRLLGLGEDEDAMKGCFWAVTNYRADIFRMPRENESLILRTTPLKTVHMIFPRCYRLLSENGELLCECSSRWVIVDSETRTAVVPKGAVALLKESPAGWNIPAAGAVKPVETSDPVLFTPPSEYFDKNGHMNNAAYFDMAETLLQSRICGKTPAFLQIEYRNELAKGRSVTAWTAEYGEDRPGFFLCGTDSDRSVFRMRMEYR